MERDNCLICGQDIYPPLLDEYREKVQGENIKVMVSVRRGAVIDVEAPPFVDVVIRDYDTEGINDSLLEIDQDGEHYREMVW